MGPWEELLEGLVRTAGAFGMLGLGWGMLVLGMMVMNALSPEPAPVRKERTSSALAPSEAHSNSYTSGTVVGVDVSTISYCDFGHNTGCCLLSCSIHASLRLPELGGCAFG